MRIFYNRIDLLEKIPIANDSIASCNSFLKSEIHSFAGGILGIGGGFGIKSDNLGWISVIKGAIGGSNLIVTFR